MIIRTKWLSRGAGQSGQALVEFTLVGFILLFLLFGMIDFCRFISTKQTIVNLSREGANEAARGSGDTVDATISNAIAAVMAGCSPLNVNANGRVIISAVYNQGNGNYKITNQIAQGSLTSASSKIGVLNATGNNVSMPFAANSSQALPPSKQTSYVAEVYYTFVPATPLGKVAVQGMHGFTVTNQMYDVAYF